MYCTYVDMCLKKPEKKVFKINIKVALTKKMTWTKRKEMAKTNLFCQQPLTNKSNID